MMLKRIILICLAATALCVTPVAAQQQIEKAINSIKKERTINDEVYSIRRNPATGKTYKEARILTLLPGEAEKLVKAMKSSFQTSSSFDSFSNEMYTIEFQRGAERRNYTLSRDGRNWTLIYQLDNPANAPSKRRRMSYTEDDDDVEYIQHHTVITRI